MADLRHSSDCVLHNAPALEPKPCDCGAQAPIELARWKSNKVVRAGEISEVTEAGCYVRQPDGLAVLMLYEPHMTARFTPKAGDFWVVYANPDGMDYYSLSPRQVFVEDYERLPT